MTTYSGPPTPPAAPEPTRRHKRAGSGPQSGVNGAGIAPPPKLRRPRTQIALAIALVAIGGLLAAWLVTGVGDTHAVLALRQMVSRGSVIGADDLTTAQINSDPTLHTVPASQRAQIVGKHAASDLVQGSLLTPDSTTAQSVPAAGQSLVGLSLTPAQMPALPLRPGDPVGIVITPGSQGAPPAAAPDTLAATVVDTHPGGGTTVQTIVDVSVPTSNAPLLAADAATGRIALILEAGQ